MVAVNDWSGSTPKQSLLRGYFLVLLKLEFISKQKLACDLHIVKIYRKQSKSQRIPQWLETVGCAWKNGCWEFGVGWKTCKFYYDRQWIMMLNMRVAWNNNELCVRKMSHYGGVNINVSKKTLFPHMKLIWCQFFVTCCSKGPAHVSWDLSTMEYSTIVTHRIICISTHQVLCESCVTLYCL